MTVEKYNQIAQSDNIPQMSQHKVNSLSKMHSNNFIPPYIDYNGPEDGMDFKGRVKNINDFEARMENGNVKEKALSLVITAVVVGMIVAGAIIVSGTDFSQPVSLLAALSPLILAYGIGGYLYSGLLESKEEDRSKKGCKDIALAILTGPFYRVYKAFQFGSPSDKQALEGRKVQLVQDMEKAKAALPNDLDPKVLVDLQNDISKKDLLSSSTKRKLESGKWTLEEIKKLHEVV